MNKSSLIFIAGAAGLIGLAIVRTLREQGFNNLLTPTHSELDLTNQYLTRHYLLDNSPEYVFMCAAMVGGIEANNTRPAEFIHANLTIQTNVIHGAFEARVAKLLFLGSSCVYPKYVPNPIDEGSLMAGPLEATNEAYAAAKIAGIKMCQSYNKQYGTRFISAMPTNLYGPGDNYREGRAHVLPALIRRFHEAKVEGRSEVVVWGSGHPRREFLYSEDCAQACILLMEEYNSSDIVNVGYGDDISIKDLAHLVCKNVGYEGRVIFDPSKPDGIAKKLINSSKINGMGWRPTVDLDEGIRRTYKDFLKGEVRK